MKKPLISIVVPVYNIPDELLECCLNSIKNQRFRDFEVIIIDDGSPLKSNLTLCKEFADTDSRFVFYQQKNSGVSVARNKGIDSAGGDWILFVDPDDWVAENYLTEMVKYVDTKADIILCDCYVNSETEENVNHFFNKKNITKDDALIQIFGNNKYYNPPYIAVGTPWAKMYNVSFLRRNNLQFDVQLRRMQDNVFNLYAFYDAEKIVYVNQSLYHYRIFQNSVSNKYSERVFDDFSKVLNSTERFLKEKNVFNQFEQAYYARIIQSFNSYAKFYYCSKDNPHRFIEKKRHFKKLIQNRIFQNAIRKIDIKQLNMQMRVLCILLRIKSFELYCLAYRLRSCLKA